MEFNIDNTIGYALNRCTILLRLNLAQRFSESGYDITPEEWVVLSRLWQKEGRSQNELAETTIKDKTTLTRLLNRMEKKGLVIRESSNEDGRVKLVYPSSYAKELKQALVPIVDELLSTCVTDIGRDEVDIAFSVLKRIEKNLLDIE